MSLPIIDISPLSSDNREDWKPVIEQIDNACRELGFFYITGHGIPPKQFDDIESMADTLFDLPIDKKQQISIEHSNNHRGWGRLSAEKLDPLGELDCKESFDMALDLSPHHSQVSRCPKLYGPNQYPDIHGFTQAVTQHYSLTLDVGLRVLKAMALALKEPEDRFTRHFNLPISVLRMLHYPSQLEASNGAGAHSDYGCITLLYQDQSGGLQVLNKQDEWMDAPPVPGSFVVNIGDLMQRWTNDIYRSTKHRVTSPTSGRSRFSMPFFLEPDFDTPVTTLIGCLKETNGVGGILQ
ncbi:2-oxoglutarate and iron-dependent oxygenase domain-containing protein [Vibrio hannami]|uniref:isopenicillin N synthase family dioxygenase n=1 Tax=Vibrio hannami TaxID=2717094 RepID=UPI0024106490|nr:2-oxoglutarate and iron-dependent oxygenase domain-containing protein [Vibrio hannami]MDG3086520.1 2-oxoglutarate and iron-dependent oxygenase domain-containing protein [Vibrio hannami]